MKKQLKDTAISALILFVSLVCIHRLEAMDKDERKKDEKNPFTQIYESLPDAINLASDEAAAPVAPLGLAAHPWIGRYGEKYEFIVPSLIVRLPKKKLSGFPDPILAKLAEYDDSKLELFLFIGSDEHFSEENLSRNLVYHLSVFPAAKQGDNLSTTCNMGLFDPNGVRAHEGKEGIPFDSFGAQDISIHPAEGQVMAFSPNNAKFNIAQKEESIVSFFSAAELPNGRATAVYAVIYRGAHTLEKAIFEAAKKERSLKNYVEFIKKTDLAKEVKERLSELLESDD
jgi:hypothetical protein